MYPFVTAELFGAERSGMNYGAVFMVYGLVSASCVLVLTFLVESGTDALVYALAGIQAFGTLLALSLVRLSASQPLRERASAANPLTDPSLLAGLVDRSSDEHFG